VSRLNAYFDTLARALAGTEATYDLAGQLSLNIAVDQAIDWTRRAHEDGNKIMIVGNGGSAAIASHTAIDFSNAGKMRTMAFNDGPTLTCLGNDFGYDQIFAKQVEFYGRPGDVLLAVSSSGRSPNILNAVKAARAFPIKVVSFSGFAADNALRSQGNLNFYVPAAEYGFVEIAHQALLHAILDLKIGWQPSIRPPQAGAENYGL
jgi:D-sedoheptulose 7-phosphate isomerase